MGLNERAVSLRQYAVAQSLPRFGKRLWYLASNRSIKSPPASGLINKPAINPKTAPFPHDGFSTRRQVRPRAKCHERSSYEFEKHAEVEPISQGNDGNVKLNGQTDHDHDNKSDQDIAHGAIEDLSASLRSSLGSHRFLPQEALVCWRNLFFCPLRIRAVGSHLRATNAIMLPRLATRLGASIRSRNRLAEG